MVKTAGHLPAVFDSTLPAPCLLLQRELKQLDEQRVQLEDMVQRSQFENKAKEQILNDTREMLR